MSHDAGTEGEILVINCGSSSLKFALLEPAGGQRLHEGIAERLGSGEATLTVRSGDSKETIPMPGATHGEALETAMRGRPSSHPPLGIGHRVVHGGEKFTAAARISPAVREAISECSPLAPLHNPANLIGIDVAEGLFPDVPQVAVFDTAFHQTMPREAFLYAIPYALYARDKIRRYGFHGTSHHFVSLEAARRLGRFPEECQLITLHLGNGCSGCAVRDGKSVDTTMGLTPSEGLVMGTRSGDVDPALHQFLQDRMGLRLADITKMLISESGLLGLSGLSNDMRTLHEAAAGGHGQAATAIEVFCLRLAKAIFALCASLDRVDAIVFTGGIGENASGVRARAMARLAVLGVEEDPDANAVHGRHSGGRITTESSRTPCLVIPTNEEWMIARQTLGVLLGTNASS